MSKYTEFFLNASASLKMYETLQISHPNFSKTYSIVRNCRNGLSAKLESGTTQAFEYYPLQIKGVSVNTTLDQSLEVQLGDLGTILPTELDRVAAANGFGTKPAVVYRSYRSDDLLTPLLTYNLEITNLTFNGQGSAFEAAAPMINSNKTGETYTFDRFPMLRGFL